MCGGTGNTEPMKKNKLSEDYRIVWDDQGVFGCKMPDDEEFQPVQRGLYAVPGK